MNNQFLYDQSLDFPDYVGLPDKIICLYFIPRSGSNLLVDLMRQTVRLGFPLEYFSPDNLLDLTKRMPSLTHNDFGALFTKRTSSNGVFSFKWNSNFENLDYGNKVRTKLAPEFHIFIDRLDRVAQARSYCIAMNTRTWIRRKGFAPSRPNFKPSGDEINTALQEVSRIRENTKRLLNATSLQYLRISAEALFSDPAATLINVFQYCEIDYQGIDIPTESIWTAPS